MLLVHLTDTHISEQGDTGGSLERLIEQCNAVLRPEAVIVTGDVTEAGDEASFQRYERAVSAAEMPVWAIAGNHDACDPRGLEHFRRYAGDLCWHHVRGNIHCFGLDSNISSAPDFTSQWQWLGDELETMGQADQALLFTHYPFAISEARYLRWGQGHTTKAPFRYHMRWEGARGFALMALLMKYRVAATFAGHVADTYGEQCVYSGVDHYTSPDFHEIGQHRLIVCDRGTVRTAVAPLGGYPVAVVTSPAAYLPGSEYKVRGQTTVRVWAASPRPVARVQWRVRESGVGGMLTQADEHIWEGAWDARSHEPRGVQHFEVTAQDEGGRIGTTSISVLVNDANGRQPRPRRDRELLDRLFSFKQSCHDETPLRIPDG